MKSPSCYACVIALAAVLSLSPVHGAHAQSPPPTWVAIGGASEGTPAEIVLDTKASTSQQSVFDVYVHGYWRTDRVGDDAMTYQVIEVPGLTSLHTLGAPDLPAGVVNVGWPTDPASVAVSAQVLGGTYTDTGILAWPQATEEQEADEGVVIPSQFMRDQSLYSLNTSYPTSRAELEEVRLVYHTIKWASVECHPVRWNPTTKVLTVEDHLRCRRVSS